MPHSTAKIRRFAIAYLAAALAAAAAMLVIQAIAVLWIERDVEVFHDYLDVTVIYVLYSFGYTLCLGLVGWGVLTVLKQRSAGAYMSTGGVLGFLAGGLGISIGFTPANFFMYGFCGAGIAAAWTFHRLYMSPQLVNIDAVAAS